MYPIYGYLIFEVELPKAIVLLINKKYILQGFNFEVKLSGVHRSKQKNYLTTHMATRSITFHDFIALKNVCLLLCEHIAPCSDTPLKD